MTTTDTDLRRIRAAKNQSVFRDVNERIEDISERFDLWKRPWTAATAMSL
jgi:hypothetical protein